MKKYVVTLLAATALTISIAFVIHKAQAQNASPQPTEETDDMEDAGAPGDMMTGAVGASTNNHEGSAIFLTEIPAGYRDWVLISVAHEEGNLNSFGAILGNEVAIT